MVEMVLTVRRVYFNTKIKLRESELGERVSAEIQKLEVLRKTILMLMRCVETAIYDTNVGRVDRTIYLSGFQSLDFL